MPTINLGQVRPVYRGVWAADKVDYKGFDWVMYAGSAYIALKDVPVNYQPDSQSTFWTLFGAKGTDGATGPAGKDGAMGPVGKDGAQGAQGIAGTQGRDGVQGAQGPAGIQGPVGPAVPLSDSLISTSTTDAASSLAVKLVNDKAIAAQTKADAAQTKAETPATETARGIGRSATVAEVTSGVSGVNGPAWVTPEKIWEIFINNKICQYTWFEDDMPREGYFSCLGGVVTNFAAKYPKAAAYFNTTYGQKRLVTQAQYDALHVAAWHTNADGTKVGWQGIGGVNKFVWDKQADTLRLPDLAGMTPEQAGLDSPGVGEVHGDGIRNITGGFLGYDNKNDSQGLWYGAFRSTFSQDGSANAAVNTYGEIITYFSTSYVVPVATKNQVRAWVSDVRVYLGTPLL